jgi:hypothetical protein
MDRRYQFFVPGNKINYKDVIYLLGFWRNYLIDKK